MNSREEKFIVSNPTEILQIRGNNVPEKVMDEGDLWIFQPKHTHSIGNRMFSRKMIMNQWP